MNWLDGRDMPMHVSVLGWVYLFGTAFLLLIAGFAFFVLPTFAAISHNADAVTILSVVGTTVGVIMVVLAIPGLFAAYGLLKHKAWSRMLTLILAVIGLVNFPFGTVIGVYSLLVLSQPAAIEYFASEKR